MRRTLFLALACLLAAFTAQAADWPRFLGPAGDATSPETSINKDWRARPPKTLWVEPLTDNGYAGICIAAGKLFIIDHAGRQDIVRALNKATGRELWRFTYETTSSNSYGYARSTPTYEGGRLYTVSRQGRLHCLDAVTGKPVWTKDYVKDFGGLAPRFGVVAAPVVVDGKLIVTPGGAKGNIAALDLRTGATIWRGGNGEVPGYVTPVLATLAGRRQLLYASGLNLLGVDPGDGKLLWAYPWPTYNGNNVANPVVLGDRVFFTSSDQYGGTMLDLAGGQPREVWTSEAIQAQFNSPLVYQGYIYSTTDPAPGALVCLDPKTGKAAWRQPGFEKGPVLIVDGVLLALAGKTGELFMIDPTPAGYKELGRCTPLGGDGWAPVAISDGKLYIRNRKKVACLDLK